MGGGLVAGAVVAHSMYLVLPVAILLGPAVSTLIGKRVEKGWWQLVLGYSAAFGAGIFFFPDGTTVLAVAWPPALFAAGVTAGLGLLVGFLSQSD